MKPTSIESLRQQLEGALEDFDAKKLKNIKLEDELKTTREFIKALQDNLVIEKNNRKELYVQLQNQDDEERETLRDIVDKLRQENSNMKNEMQDLTMRPCKDIEDRKRNEEDLARRLNERSDESQRLSYENDMLKTDLIHMQHDKDELLRHVTTLETELVTANEYKDKFKKSSDNLDDMLKSQKPDGETIGLGFEHGESLGTANNHDHNKLVRQPNAYKFNGKCFNCNKFGHRANQCRFRNN